MGVGEKCARMFIFTSTCDGGECRSDKLENETACLCVFLLVGHQVDTTEIKK